MSKKANIKTAANAWKKWAVNFPVFASKDEKYKSPFRVVRAQKKTERDTIYITGVIGNDFFGDGSDATSDFAAKLDEIPKSSRPLLAINSPGGNFYAGLGIYNLAQMRGVDTIVLGQAASAASHIFCSGINREIPDESNVMIHKAMGGYYGNADGIEDFKTSLDNVDDIQASIYSKTTGKTKEEVLAKMSGDDGFGTEWNGCDAREFGFGCAPGADADDESAEEVQASIRTAIFAMSPPKISAPPQGAANQPTNTNSQIMNKTQMLALLKTWGVTVPDNATDDQIVALVTAGPKPVAPAPATPPAAAKPTAPAAPAEPTLDPVTMAEFRAEKRRRVRAEISRLGENRIPNDKIDTWTDRALAAEKEESIYDEISAMARFDTGGDPIGFNRIESMRTPILAGYQGQPTDMVANLFKETTHADSGVQTLKRYNALRDNWDHLFADASNRDRRLGRDIRAENNFAGAITTNFLIMGAITKLGPRCTALKAFSRDNSVDPYKPLASGIQKFNTTVQDGSDTQTNATDFTASSDSTLTGPAINVSQYTQGMHLTNAQLNSGIRMADLIEAKLGSLLSKIVQVVTTPITVATFNTYAPDVVSSAAFGFSDLALLQGKLQKSRIKNVILAGPYIAQIANTPAFFQIAGTLDGLEDAWRAFGWDLIGLNTEWQGADPYVQGFACNPQAIGVITGLPLNPVEGIPGNVIQVGTAVLPGVDVALSTYLWMDANARTMRATYDIMLGATAIDTTAGVIIKSQ